MGDRTEGLKGSIIGVQMTLIGFFVAWAFQLQFVGLVLVLIGTVVVVFNTFYR